MLLCFLRDSKPTRNKEHPTDVPLDHPDRIQITFDDRRLVANAGLLLPVTLGTWVCVNWDHHLDLGNAPGRANPGDKMLTLVASALAGGDCIDVADVLRTGGTAQTLGCVVKAPSTLGTFLARSVPAQLPVGPRPPIGSGQPGAAGTGLVGWGRTRRRAIHHRWIRRSASHMVWPRRERATTATRARGATRCWPWPLAPATC